MKKIISMVLSLTILLISINALADYAENNDCVIDSYSVDEDSNLNNLDNDIELYNLNTDTNLDEDNSDFSAYYFDTDINIEQNVSEYSLGISDEFNDGDISEYSIDEAVDVTKNNEYAAVSSLQFSSSKPIKGYVIYTGNVTVYQSSTSQNKYGTIYGKTDEIRIIGHSDSRIKVTYPTSKGLKTGWIKESEVTRGCISSPTRSYRASEKIITYRRSDLSQNYGYISAGDTVYTIFSLGNVSQVIYSVSGGWKIGWIKNPSNQPPAGPNPGTYTIVSKLDNNKVADIDNASRSSGANLHLYESNGTSAQKFDISKSGDGYIITAKCSNRVLDVAGGSRSSGANVQQWESNGTRAQKWYFEDAGNGYYYIKSALGNYLDVSGGYTNNGTNIQVYSFNGSNAQKWKLVSTNNITQKTMTNALYNINITSSKISCGFDGYVNTPGRHEGIDFNYENGKAIYSLINGVITNVVEGRDGGALSTIAIYDKTNDKTVIYLHSNPSDSLRIGMTINKGDKIGTESWRGCSSSGGGHTHVEVRNGKKTNAAKSVNDYKLDNSNPKSYWQSWGYDVK